MVHVFSSPLLEWENKFIPYSTEEHFLLLLSLLTSPPPPPPPLLLPDQHGETDFQSNHPSLPLFFFVSHSYFYILFNWSEWTLCLACLCPHGRSMNSFLILIPSLPIPLTLT